MLTKPRLAPAWLPAPARTLLRLAVLAGLALALFGCANSRKNKVEHAAANVMYQQAKKLMTESNYQRAIKIYLQLQSQYPFSAQTRQAELDLIYAYYMSKQPASAIDAAEQFERENPTHPRVDYALYMKGLIYFDPAPNVLERFFNINLEHRPPKDTMKSYAAFQQLLRRFPDSPYAADARQRMIYLRDRLAVYENYVAGYYMKRKAYVAAANRAKYALEHYAKAPALKDSLKLLVSAYRAMGMEKLADDAERVYQLNETDNAQTANATAPTPNQSAIQPPQLAQAAHTG